MTAESAKDEHDSEAELAAAVHRVLAILTDLRSDAHKPELKERIKLVQWLRQEREVLLVHADARRDSASAPGPSAAR